MLGKKYHKTLGAWDAYVLLNQSKMACPSFVSFRFLVLSFVFRLFTAPSSLFFSASESTRVLVTNTLMSSSYDSLPRGVTPAMAPSGMRRYSLGCEARIFGEVVIAASRRDES